MSDLIERLRTIEMREVIRKDLCEAADQLEAQQAEIARLREALERCAETPHSGWTIAQSLARAALSTSPTDRRNPHDPNT